MENKFKAVLITIFIWIVAAVGVYGFLRNAQFIGVLLISALVMVISIGLYQEIFSTLEDKSKNNKKEKL